MPNEVLDTFTGSAGSLASHTPEAGGPVAQIDGTMSLDGSGHLVGDNSGGPGHARYALSLSPNSPVYIDIVFGADDGIFAGVGCRVTANGSGLYLIVFSNRTFGLYYYDADSSGFQAIGAALGPLPAGSYRFRLTPNGPLGGLTTLEAAYRLYADSAFAVAGTRSVTRPLVVGDRLGVTLAGNVAGGSGTLVDRVSADAVAAAGLVALNYYDKTSIDITAGAPVGLAAPVTHQWYGASRTNDAVGNATCTLLAGKTSLHLNDAPGSRASIRGLFDYFCVSTGSDGQTVRTQDALSPLGDYDPLAIMAYGTSMFAHPGPQEDPTCPPHVAGRAVAKLRGVRKVWTLNNGQGGSNTGSTNVGWHPTAAGEGANIPGTGLSYYTWSVQRTDAFLAALGRSLDWVWIMHETNDVQYMTQAQYQSNMQATIDALRSRYPTARFVAFHAPVNYLGLVPGTYGSPVGDHFNDSLALFQATTDALVAANPGLVYGADQTLWRYSGSHLEERELTASPQPAQQIHWATKYETIGFAMAQTMDSILFPATSGGGGGGNVTRKSDMRYSEPASNITAVAIDGTTPVKLFASRSGGNSGWQCANNTGQTVCFLEVRKGEVPTAAQAKAAGERVADGAMASGGAAVGDVYAILAAAGSCTVYPRECSQEVG